MFTIEIPGFKNLALEYLVLEFDGVLAQDGKLIKGVHERLQKLATGLQLHVITADTFGSARSALEGADVVLTLLRKQDQSVAKWRYVDALGPDRTVCMGNGRNDCLMLKKAALSIAVGGMEGLAVEALQAAHIYAPSVQDALGFLESPKRLVARLRD